jgi:O-antigen ligase
LWLNRVANFLIVNTFLISVIRKVSAPVRNTHNQLQWLLVSFLAYFIFNYILNSIFGSYPGFIHQPIYVALLFTAVLISKYENIALILFWVRNALLAFCIASFFSIFLIPDIVLQQGYDAGFMPVRFWGLAAHANSMGPITVAGLCALICCPLKSRKIGYLAHTILLAMLIGTQSKAAIFAMALCYIYLLYLKIQSRLENQGKLSRGVSPMLVLLIGSMALLLTILLIFSESGYLDKYLGSQAAQSMLTLTNRDIIWRAAIAELYKNPLFGYGVTIFDENFRHQIAIASAIHGHNQLIHSLGAAGILGALALLAYAALLAKYAIKAAKSTKGLSVCLLLLITVRCITEIPLSLHASVSIEVIIHLSLLMMIVGANSAIKPNFLKDVS